MGIEIEMAKINRRGLMLVLSSPSGAGKTSICRELLSQEENLKMSISATTRPRRPGEVHGVDYNFIDGVQFDKLIKTGALLEYAKVFDYYYGTPRDQVENALEIGQDVLAESVGLLFVQIDDGGDVWGADLEEPTRRWSGSEGLDHQIPPPLSPLSADHIEPVIIGHLSILLGPQKLQLIYLRSMLVPLMQRGEVEGHVLLAGALPESGSLAFAPGDLELLVHRRLLVPCQDWEAEWQR